MRLTRVASWPHKRKSPRRWRTKSELFAAADSVCLTTVGALHSVLCGTDSHTAAVKALWIYKGRAVRVIAAGDVYRDVGEQQELTEFSFLLFSLFSFFFFCHSVRPL